MNLLKTIIAVGFGIMMFSSQSEELTIPEGTAEGVVVNSQKLACSIVSSQSEKLIIPEGDAKGVVVNSQKLACSIADEFDTVSEVFDVSMESELYLIEAWTLGLADQFTVSFSLRTTGGSTYTNIQCKAGSTSVTLELIDCKNDEVKLSNDFITISLVHIEDENAEPRYVR